MTTAEVAAQYGVPLPETCKELNWENIDTNFFWLVCNNTQRALLHIIQENRFGEKCYHPVNNGFAHNKFKVYPAPQMHEIAKLLPEKLLNYKGYESVEFCENEKVMGYGILNRFLATEIKNHHYAQAYAEMYLKLKTLNLLK